MKIRKGKITDITLDIFSNWMPDNLASELYLGGSFTTAGTVTVNRVASYII